MSKKAELTKRLDEAMLYKEMGQRLGRYYDLAREAINAIPDEEEKAFVPFKVGYYKLKRKECGMWEIAYVGSQLFVFLMGGGGSIPIDEVEGKWKPDRILMPGEE